MRINIITIFPHLFDRVLDFGMIQQARKKELLEIRIVDLRDFTEDKRRTVDDRPYGGGDGMVLKPEPIFLAVEKLSEKAIDRQHVVLLTPQGRLFDQAAANRLSLKANVTLICGRYEGVDQRVTDHLVDEEISIGDYVLSGGEYAALVIVDAVSRLIPGVVAKGGSVLQESFMDGMLDYPHYTRPPEFRGWQVPDVLLSGDHVEIARWRERRALELTRQRRPDLLNQGKNAENPE
ncbi:MAG: tRNA (guanosine(37)-N1)-methyltransferase TrmD [Acidobacteria bacterium]|nr:MAG: tRNA (guanosine(37)-N1)-methyltransferase TrmD [Acidobacteriota bacterium]